LPRTLRVIPTPPSPERPKPAESAGGGRI
jgi:hypothetical protein